MAKEKNTKNTAEPKFPLIYLVPLIAASRYHSFDRSYVQI